MTKSLVRSLAIRSGVAVTALLVISAAASGTMAQIRFGGARPTVLAPRPVTPAQKQSPAKPPVLNMALADPGPIGAATTTALFAQVAVGGGYSTVFTFVNTGGTRVDGNLILTSFDGTPLNVTLSLASPNPGLSNLDDRVSASSTSISIPPGGTKFVTASGAGTTVNGWGRVESDGGTLGGVATFQFTSGGVVQTVAGVLSSAPVDVATIPVDNDAAQGRQTGFAVANATSSSVNVKIVVIDENGNIVDSASPPELNPLGPRKQLAKFLNEVFPARSTMKGSMVLIPNTPGAIAVVALVLVQQPAGGFLLTTIPVIPAKAPGIN